MITDRNELQSLQIHEILRTGICYRELRRGTVVQVKVYTYRQFVRSRQFW